MKRLNAVIAMVALILVLSTVGCSLGLSEAERAYNDGNDSLRQGHYKSAIADYDKAIQLDPDFALPYLNLGVSYHNLGQDQRAIQDYDKAIQLDPDNALAYYNRAAALRKLGQLSLAKKILIKPAS